MFAPALLVNQQLVAEIVRRPGVSAAPLAAAGALATGALALHARLVAASGLVQLLTLAALFHGLLTTLFSLFHGPLALTLALALPLA